MASSPPRFGVLGLYAILYLVFLYGPVSLIVLFSFNDSIYVSFPLRGFTLRWYREMANSPDLVGALQASLTVAVGVSLVATILGLLTAKALTQHRVPGRNGIIGLVMMPLVIPGLVIAVPLLVVLSRFLHVQLSLLTIAAAHVMLCVPFATIVIASRFESFDRSFEEASLDLGEGAWWTFWRVTFPLIWPGIASSVLLCFTTSFDEYIFASFLSGNQATLPLYIFSQLRFPQRLPSVLSLGSCILVGSAVIVLLSEYIRSYRVDGFAKKERAKAQ